MIENDRNDYGKKIIYLPTKKSFFRNNGFLFLLFFKNRQGLFNDDV